MNMVHNFQFEQTRVRSILRGDEPWFVLIDVCKVLDISNSRDAASRLDDDEKGVGTADTLGGEQELTIINESGLYSLILTSRKAAARRFKKWVTAEVLPTLRRTGQYVMREADEDLPALADGKVFGVAIRKVNAAARLISLANAIYGPEAARALWSTEKDLPKLDHLTVAALTGTPGDDPTGCLCHLFRAVMPKDSATLISVRERFEQAETDPQAVLSLIRVGIQPTVAGRPEMVAIADRHPFLAAHFADTQWNGYWADVLRKLPGADRPRHLLRFPPFESRATLVPRDVVVRLTGAKVD